MPCIHAALSNSLNFGLAEVVGFDHNAVAAFWGSSADALDISIESSCCSVGEHFTDKPIAKVRKKPYFVA